MLKNDTFLQQTLSFFCKLLVVIGQTVQNFMHPECIHNLRLLPEMMLLPRYDICSTKGKIVLFTKTGLMSALNRGPIIIKPDFMTLGTMSSHDSSAQTISNILHKSWNVTEISNKSSALGMRRSWIKFESIGFGFCVFKICQIEQGLTSHQTHYRSYWGRFL